MAEKTAQTDPDSGIEYTIYTFDHPKPNEKGRIKWQKNEMLTEMGKALKQAEELFASGKYKKVEVKQKYFETKTNRNVDMTLRVFEETPKIHISTAIVTSFAVFCGIAAFAITVLLMK